ncbi:MAG: SufE family protein [Gammaproteobacteria bacterium]|jgi:cysteine desulfuration protein SufE
MSSPAEKLTSALIEDFEFLEDWPSRYAYLIELGEKLPALDERYRTEDNRVKGCMSQVWVHAAQSPGSRKIDYTGDCDTAIIKGILAVLIELMSGLTVEEIEELDLESLFDALQLRENLSPSRHFGVYAIVELMKQQARETGASPARLT